MSRKYYVSNKKIQECLHGKYVTNYLPNAYAIQIPSLQWVQSIASWEMVACGQMIWTTESTVIYSIKIFFFFKVFLFLVYYFLIILCPLYCLAPCNCLSFWKMFYFFIFTRLCKAHDNDNKRNNKKWQWTRCLKIITLIMMDGRYRGYFVGIFDEWVPRVCARVNLSLHEFILSCAHLEKIIQGYDGLCNDRKE